MKNSLMIAAMVVCAGSVVANLAIVGRSADEHSSTQPLDTERTGDSQAASAPDVGVRFYQTLGFIRALAQPEILDTVSASDGRVLQEAILKCRQLMTDAAVGAVDPAESGSLLSRADRHRKIARMRLREFLEERIQDAELVDIMTQAVFSVG